MKWKIILNQPRKKYLLKKNYNDNYILAKATVKSAKKVKRNLHRAYVFQTLIRLLVEIIFLLLFHKYFTLHINPLFKCTEDPCPNTGVLR